MIAYKGFTAELTARLGSGIYQFREGETAEKESSKTARCGFHCTENPFECLSYYPLGEGNRYFQVAAEGSIDEDDEERIACTRLTLLKELTIKELAGYGMMYMIQHPARKKWQQDYLLCQIRQEEAHGTASGAIAIARGKHPVVSGTAGSILGLIVEPEPGIITEAKLFEVAPVQQGLRFTLSAGRKLKEVAR